MTFRTVRPHVTNVFLHGSETIGFVFTYPFWRVNDANRIDDALFSPGFKAHLGANPIFPVQRRTDQIGFDVLNCFRIQAGIFAEVVAGIVHDFCPTHLGQTAWRKRHMAVTTFFTGHFVGHRERRFRVFSSVNCDGTKRQDADESGNGNFLKHEFYFREKFDGGNLTAPK